MPKLSVVMPFYNCEKYLDEAILSILDQTFTDFELILINDASTDDSDIVAKKYLGDSRITYIKNETNKKIVYNLNLGLSIARADIIARMDGDDISHVTRFEKQYRYLQDNPEIALVGSFVELIDFDGNSLGKIIKPTSPKKISEVAMFYAPFIHPSIMFKKSIVSKLGNYRDNYPHEDIDLFFRVIFSGNQTNNLPEYLLKYRQHENNSGLICNHRIVAKRIYQLKKEITKQYHPKLNLISHLSIPVMYFLEIVLTFRQRQKVEYLIKKFFIWSKII